MVARPRSGDRGRGRTLATWGLWYNGRAMATMEERVSRLEGAYEQLDQRLGDIQASLQRIDARIDRLEAKVDAQFRTMMAVMVTGGIAIAGAIITLALRI